MTTTRSVLVSEAQFLALPESMEKVELLDGEMIVAPAQFVRHQDVVRRVVVALSNWAASRSEPLFVGQSPLDVRFGENRILQPDASSSSRRFRWTIAVPSIAFRSSASR